MKLSNLIVKVIGEEKKGISAATGREWASRNIILYFLDEEGSENYISARVSGDTWDKAGITQPETIVACHLRFTTRSYNTGFVANEVRITNIQKA